RADDADLHLDQLDRERDGFPSAEAQRRDAATLAARAERVEQRDEQTRTARADRVTERDGTAVHVELRLGDVELATDALDAAERLVDLEQIDVGHRPAGLLE